MNWWIYAIVFGGIIAVYLLSALIIRLLMNKASKKAHALYDKMIPVEKDRYDVILQAQKKLEDDDRHLPKNMVESTMDVQKEFEKIPCDIATIKGMNDFLIVYYRKYIKEKRLLPRYPEIDAKLESKLFLNPESKESPYYDYNKAVLKYNSYLNMGFLNLFRGKAQRLPTL